jgi:hypothetical protein
MIAPISFNLLVTCAAMIGRDAFSERFAEFSSLFLGLAVS